MAFALALQSTHDLPESHGRTIFTATTAIVVLTVLLIGGSTSTMLEVLEVTGESNTAGSGESLDEENEYLAPAFIGDNDTSSTQNLKMRFREFQRSTATFTAIDKNFLTPFFTARNEEGHPLVDGNNIAGEGSGGAGKTYYRPHSKREEGRASFSVSNRAASSQEGANENGTDGRLRRLPSNNVQSEMNRLHADRDDGKEAASPPRSSPQDGRPRQPRSDG